MHQLGQRLCSVQGNASPAGGREIECAGRAAHLISHNTDLCPFTMQTQHRQGEIFADRTDHPAGSHDQGTGVCSEHSLDGFLSSRFAGSVDPDGVPDLIRSVWRSLRSVEDKIGADLQHPSSLLLQGFCEYRRGLGIHGIGQISFCFSLVDSCVGPCIQNPVRLMVPDSRTTGLFIRQIQV